KNSLNRLIRCVCGKKIGPDPRNFNQRVSLGRNDLLIRTFPKVVELRFSAWLVQQRQAGVEFDESQLEWLKMIKKQIAENAEMMIEVFEYAPFNQQGGVF
ncbi:type I restriction-modification enzyme R subunit C-terminal domain-containing protein, partial [Klebsiella pneumoniae]